jgi:hypothetical protein
MIGRADIEGSKSNVAMNAWLPQASYPCGNFSDISSLTFQGPKGSIGHAFAVCILTENINQVSFYPFVLHEISVLIELTLGHLRYSLTNVPPQPNSPFFFFFWYTYIIRSTQEESPLWTHQVGLRSTWIVWDSLRYAYSAIPTKLPVLLVRLSSHLPAQYYYTF